MNSIAVKFGGTSLASAEQFRKVRAIIEADPRRRFIAVSAPGKRTKEDQKITDLLLVCHDLAAQSLDIAPAFSHIRERFTGIAEDLGVDYDTKGLLDAVEREIQTNPGRDYIASRGEHITAKIFAAWIGATYVEPAETIRLRNEFIHPDTYKKLGAKLKGDGLFVMPGFYGADAKGKIKTFPRGGSDITGSILARAANADLYENWTDVSGFLMADPRIVDKPRQIAELTYRELRELSYMGAVVLHDEAIFPVREVGIPIEIRNTNAPDDPGTRIVPSRTLTEWAVTGIAGRKNFMMFQIEKSLMNKMVGFGRRVLEIFESQNVSYDHTPTGIDTMSVVVSAENLNDKADAIVDELNGTLKADRVDVVTDLALIATVGEGMAHRVGIAAKLFGALAKAGVNVRIIDQGSSEINIIVGVQNKDYETAIRCIYHAFVEG